MSPARRLLRNTGYAALLGAWLVVMLLPCAAFALAARGELEWRRGEEGDRIWLIQERDQKGIGYQAQRLLSSDQTEAGTVCVRNSIRFFLWEGAEDAQNTEYCECRAADGASQTIDCP